MPVILPIIAKTCFLKIDLVMVQQESVFKNLTSEV